MFLLSAALPFSNVWCPSPRSFSDVTWWQFALTSQSLSPEQSLASTSESIPHHTMKEQASEPPATKDRTAGQRRTRGKQQGAFPGCRPAGAGCAAWTPTRRRAQPGERRKAWVRPALPGTLGADSGSTGLSNPRHSTRFSPVTQASGSNVSRARPRGRLTKGG